MKHKYYFFWAATLIFIMSTGCSALETMGISAPTETATPLPTNTATLAPTETPIPTATQTMVPSPTPTTIGGGSGKIVFNAYVGEQGSGRQNIYLHDMEENKTQLILMKHLLHDISPDGKQLLVSKGRNLYIADLDGLIQSEVTEQFNYVAGFLNEGQSDDIVVFTKEVNGNVQAFFKHSDGQVEQVTESPVGVMDFQLPLFGEYFLWEEGYSTRTASYTFGWRLTNVETKEINELTSKEPVISPDGQYLAYTIESDVFLSTVIRVTDQEGETVIELPAADYVENPSPSSVYFYPIESYGWGPDNNSLFVSIHDVSTSKNMPVANVLINLDGEVLQEINTDFIPAAWSPDGKQYVGYKRVGDPPHDRHVLFMSADFTQEDEVLMASGIGEEILFFNSVFWLP